MCPRVEPMSRDAPHGLGHGAFLGHSPGCLYQWNAARGYSPAASSASISTGPEYSPSTEPRTFFSPVSQKPEDWQFAKCALGEIGPFSPRLKCLARTCSAWPKQTALIRIIRPEMRAGTFLLGTVWVALRTVSWAVDLQEFRLQHADSQMHRATLIDLVLLYSH